MGGGQIVKDNIVATTAKFLYECTFTNFGCPLTIVTNQGMHLKYDAIKHLTNCFLLKYVSSTTYYLQRNG